MNKLRIYGIKQLIKQFTKQLIKRIKDDDLSNGSLTLLSLGMIIALWTTSKGIKSLIKGINRAYDVKETRSFIQVQPITLVTTFTIPFLILTNFMLLVLGDTLGTKFFTVLLLWLNMSSLIIVIGGEINATIADFNKSSTNI